MKNKFLKIGLGATVASVIAAGVFATAMPASAQSAAPGTTHGQSTQQNLGGRQGGHRGAQGMHMAEIAKALGMTEVDLKTELQAGKSVADIAAAKNVSLDSIVSAIVTAQTERLKQAVTDGKLTQAQADTMIANLKLTVPSRLQTKWVGQPLNDGGQRGGKGAGGGMREGLQVVAKTLGITDAELRTELQAGKSVADVATTKNVSINTLVDAVIAEQTTVLKQAVTDGKLTQAQADQRLALLKTNLPKLFELKGGMGGFGGPGGRGLGGNRGPKPNTAAPSTNSTPDPNA